MKPVTESAAPIWKDDINYPGVPALPVSKTTSRATVTYETYVLDYAARQRGHVLLATAGLIMALGAMYLIDNNALLVLFIALGVGGIMSGSIGFAIAADAHASYTRNLAVSVSETWERRQPPAPATVRPFVASSDGDGRTTNTGRLNFTPPVWQALFNRAMSNGGFIDRDNVCKKAGIGRRWYHSDPNSADGFRAFLAELRQIQFVDDRNRLTDIALTWYAQQIGLPLDAIPLSPSGPNGAVNSRSVAGRSVNTRSHGETAVGWGGS